MVAEWISDLIGIFAVAFAVILMMYFLVKEAMR